MSYKFTKLQEKWLKALESGKYKATKNYLCTRIDDGVGYCCLGVACEVAGIPKLALTSRGDIIKFDEEVSRLPDYLAAKLKMYSNGRLHVIASIDGVNYTSLTEMNDNGFLTHPQIAAYIRANPENVFENENKTEV